jgi:hypothetical protein
MAGPHVLSDALLEILEASRLWFLREQRQVEILEGVATNAPYDDAIILGIPFQDGSRYEFEALANFGWNRDLPLSREPGLSELHAYIVPR